jgi:hypothetical protein
VLWPVPVQVNPDFGGPVFRCFVAKSLADLEPQLQKFPGRANTIAIVNVTQVAAEVDLALGGEGTPPFRRNFAFRRKP